MKKLLPLVLVASCAQVYHPMMKWEQIAFPKDDANTYIYKYYLTHLNGERDVKGVVIRGVTCKVTEVPDYWICTSPVPRVVGRIQLSTTYPKVLDPKKAEGPLSAPIVVGLTAPK